MPVAVDYLRDQENGEVRDKKCVESRQEDGDNLLRSTEQKPGACNGWYVAMQLVNHIVGVP